MLTSVTHSVKHTRVNPHVLRQEFKGMTGVSKSLVYSSEPNAPLAHYDQCDADEGHFSFEGGTLEEMLWEREWFSSRLNAVNEIIKALKQEKKANVTTAA